MGIFKDWAEKRHLAESEINNPISGQSLGGSPFISGLNKLQRGLKAGEIPNGYGGYSVIANKFGLSPEETKEMLNRGLIAKDQHSTNINTERLQMFLRQMPGQSPNPRVTPANRF